MLGEYTCTTYGGSRLWWHVCTCGVVVAKFAKNGDSTTRRIPDIRVKSWGFESAVKIQRERKSRGNEGCAKISLETYRSREIFRVVSGYDTRAKKEIEQHNPRFVAYLPWHESLTIRTNVKKTGNSFSAAVHWKQICVQLILKLDFSSYINISKVFFQWNI